jgi:exocyst complex component 2
MASDSDEEDRLLQMALKEQEDRDLTYQKPPRSTPVVNLVQQPATRSNQRNPGSNANSRSRGNPAKPKGRARAPSRGGDDDDDSEVELLSISSGDEDSSKDRVVPVRGRTGGSDRRSSRDEGEFGWDDDEPRSWKRVDEAEVHNSLEFSPSFFIHLKLCDVDAIEAALY